MNDREIKYLCITSYRMGLGKTKPMVFDEWIEKELIKELKEETKTKGILKNYNKQVSLEEMIRFYEEARFK